MVNIVMLSTGPERNEVVQAPWKLISTVSIDGLEETGNDPKVHCENVQVVSDHDPANWHHNSSSSKYHDFDWRGILSGEAEGRRVLVVNLVDALIQRTPMHRAVSPVMPCILQNEEDGNLDGHFREGWKRNAGIHAGEFCHWVEEPDLREFDSEVTEEDELGALPLFGPGRDFRLYAVSRCRKA